jgi:D-tyrosyl-tRNA(Tyr) deacylase
MKIVIQRVLSASCNVEGEQISNIGLGLLVFCGVTANDTEEDIKKAAKKISGMRIFRNDAGKMSLAVNDVEGAIMLISNFTLCADCSHGRRPEFTSAAPAAKAEEYYNKLAALLGETNKVVCGVFGGDMRISAENFGPVTVYLDTASL